MEIILLYQECWAENTGTEIITFAKGTIYFAYNYTNIVHAKPAKVIAT